LPPAPGAAAFRRSVATAVPDADLNQQLLGGGLRVLDEYVEVSIVVEHARIQQLVFQLQPTALPVDPHEVFVGIRGLRILVEILHVGVSWRAVETEVVALLDVLAVVAFGVGQSEQALPVWL
jgi:hypothetical protein